jgi:hypothetical protein
MLDRLRVEQVASPATAVLGGVVVSLVKPCLAFCLPLQLLFCGNSTSLRGKVSDWGGFGRAAIK